jgi:hypothetical protein
MRKNDFFFLPFSVILDPRLRARDMARKSERRWIKSEDRLKGWRRKRDLPKKSEGLWDFWTKHSNLKVLSTGEEPNRLNKEQRVNNKKNKNIFIQPISRWSWSMRIVVWVVVLMLKIWLKIVDVKPQDLLVQREDERGWERGWENLEEKLLAVRVRVLETFVNCERDEIKSHWMQQVSGWEHLLSLSLSRWETKSREETKKVSGGNDKNERNSEKKETLKA